jgi:Flp pilus assembly protein TadG
VKAVKDVGQTGRPRLLDPAHKTKAQSLIELTLLTPLMVGIIAVLFQFGILFIAYLSLVHATRDVGRWIAVHPDTTDTNAVAYARADMPSVIDPNLTSLLFSPPCTSTPCTDRTAYSALQLTVSYNASSIIFLPTNFRLGPWMNVAIPTALPNYPYTVMVEQH